MHYKGLGQVESKTIWSKNGKKKTITELQDLLIEIIKLSKQCHVPDEPQGFRLEGKVQGDIVQ